MIKWFTKNVKSPADVFVCVVVGAAGGGMVGYLLGFIVCHLMR